MIPPVERRKVARFEAHIPMNLSISEDPQVSWMTTISQDVSLTGLFCTIAQEIALNTVVHVALAASEAALKRQRFAFQCMGRVIRINQAQDDTGQTVYQLGIAFEPLPQTDQVVLQTLISLNTFTNLAMITVSVVVPVYNGQDSLDELCLRIQTVLTPLVQQFEIILVNDGSRDQSWQVITRQVSQYHNIRGVNLMRNYGQDNALLAGIQLAYYEIIVTLDDDLQHPPEEIPNLLAKLLEGYDIVYGKPAHKQHGTWRNVTSVLFYQVLNLVMGSTIGEHLSAFRAFRSVLRRGFERFTDTHLSIDALLAWNTQRITHILIKHEARKYGASGYTLKKLWHHAMSMLTGYSHLPVRLAISLGLLTTGLGLFLGILGLSLHFSHVMTISGSAFVILVITLFSGVQLCAIGILGEYLVRLHFRTMGQPAYVIRDEVAVNPSLTQEMLPHVKNIQPSFFTEDGTPVFLHLSRIPNGSSFDLPYDE